jgi:antitoxin component of RelBE/YafQ-DinJ toxin-antitoxin module
MDRKITLSFDSEVIEKAKKYAAEQNMSLSRLIEYLLRRVTDEQYLSVEHFPVAEWVNKLSEGPAEYRTPKKRLKTIRHEYFNYINRNC